MAQPQKIRNDDTVTNDPVNISDRAIDNLKFIRETMERSTVFTSVPGYGGILMGATAVVAAYVAHSQVYIRDWLTVWVAEAVLAFFIGLLAMWQKSKLSNNSLLSTPARKLLLNSLPPMLCGVFITVGLYRFGHFDVMIPSWILCYGAAVVCGGAFSVKAVPAMGWCFIALGAVAFFVPAGAQQLMMALSFGVLHIVFGFIIGRKFGG
jgi:hypothetical protein